MSTIYICNRCGEMMSRIYTSFTFDYFKGHPNRACKIFDICKECHEEFEKFMKPTKDESSNVKLRPWSEVGPPPKINGYPLASENEYCAQCKFKDFSWDEEPCSTCKYSVMSVGDDPSDNFESKEEEDSVDSTDVDDILSEAKYKIGSYIQSDIVKGSIYKIIDIRLRDDDEFVYKVENSSSGIQNLIWERVIDKYYTVIVKYSCDGCKLEGTDDCMCDTCIVGDPKGPRRQWWRPKEEE